MAKPPILASGHTTSEGILSLQVDTGVPDSDVMLEIRLLPTPSAVAPVERDENGWPVGFLERFAGSMPDLERGHQGDYEDRLPL